jgi:hypothetical protein
MDRLALGDFDDFHLFSSFSELSPPNKEPNQEVSFSGVGVFSFLIAGVGVAAVSSGVFFVTAFLWI